MTEKHKSDAFAAIHETAAGMYDAGVINKQTMRSFDNSCLVPPFTGGNVFRDLGLPDAEDLLAKANLALHIRQAIEARKLTQVQAARILGLDQSQVFSIINGRLDDYSNERLMQFLNDLGCDVKISVSAPHSGVRGHLAVVEGFMQASEGEAETVTLLFTAKEKQLLEAAAEIRRLPVDEFILQSAYAAAEQAEKAETKPTPSSRK